VAADITDEAQVAEAARTIGDLGRPTRIVVATGLLHADGVAPEKALRMLDPEALMTLFRVNAVAPALVAKHLLPLTPRDRVSLFAALSARVGSISDNRLGGWYGYRASKAALNMLIATLAIEHRRTRPQGICVALHPGTVETGLSAPFRHGATAAKRLTPDQSAKALIEVMDRLSPEDSGSFLAWDGQPIPW
ncbi:MAG: SDR family oxidoreductase, partial [Brevundimonas sp.]